MVTTFSKSHKVYDILLALETLLALAKLVLASAYFYSWQESKLVLIWLHINCIIYSIHFDLKTNMDVFRTLSVNSSHLTDDETREGTCHLAWVGLIHIVAQPQLTISIIAPAIQLKRQIRGA